MIFPVGKNHKVNPPQDSGGFTLLELVLVMVVIALGITVALPRLPDLTGSRAEASIRRVALLVTAVRDRAVSLRRHYRLNLDVGSGSITASYFGPEGVYILDEDVVPLDLPGQVRLVDVMTAEAGKVVDGQGHIHISPKGFVEAAAIHLDGARGKHVTIWPDALGVDVRILDGHVELSTR